jgi:hypothetical protein
MPTILAAETELSRRNSRAPTIQPISPQVVMRDPITSEWLHFTGDRVTDKREWRWVGTREQADTLRSRSRIAASLTVFRVHKK